MADPVPDPDPAIVLNDGQLRQLADLVYHQEVEAIKNHKFNSELDRSKCLRDSQSCHNSLLGLLNSANQIQQEYKDDETLAPIANDSHAYLLSTVHISLMLVRNFVLRTTYLSKIKEHYNMIKEGLKTIDRKNVINIARLAKDASIYRNAMLEYIRKQSAPVSRAFAKMLKDTGVSYDRLLERYKSSRKYTGAFRNLRNKQKLNVLNDIIAASGRGRVIVNKMSTALGIAGIGVLIFAAGMMVWDVFTSDNKLQTAIHHAIQTLAAVGGGTLGQYAGIAIATGLLGAAATPVFVVVAGILGGIAGAFILGELAGRLVDMVFDSGDTTNANLDGIDLHLHQCCVAPMPDGQLLARQIGHQNN